MDHHKHTNDSDASHITSTARTISTNSPKKPKKLKILAGIVLLIGLVALSIYVYLAYFYNLPPKGIYADLKGQQITQSDFNEIYNAYLKFDESNAKDGAKVDQKQVERKVADEVLLRLALQAEAQTHNVAKCTSEIVDQGLADNYASNGGKNQYYGLLKSTYDWTPVVSTHKECLAYYQEKLTTKLIDGVDLFGVYIRWDVAKGQSAEIRSKLDTYAKQRLETEYLPLFENGTSQEDIIAKTDITASLPSAEFSGRVMDFNRSASRYTMVSQMNSLAYSEFQQYEEGESELPYIENLKAGQNTKPFKSKTGYWIIYRATGRNQSAYKSLDELRSAYVKKGKVSKSYFSLPPTHLDTSRPEYLGSPSKKSSFMNNLKALLAPTANAAHFNTGGQTPCFDTLHGVTMTLRYFDKDTGVQIPGVRVLGAPSAHYPGPNIMTSNNNVDPPPPSTIGPTWITDWCKDEPVAGIAFGSVNITYPNHYLSYDVGTMPAPPDTPYGWNFLLSCAFEWDYKFNPPAGYQAISDYGYRNSTDRFQVKMTGATVYTVMKSDPDNPAGYYRIPSLKWIGISNGGTAYGIDVYFTKKKTAIEIRKTPANSAGPNDARTNVTSQTATISDWNTDNPNTISDLWLPTGSNYYQANVEVPVGWAVKDATVDGVGKPVTCVTDGAYVCSVRVDIRVDHTSEVVFNFIVSAGDIVCQKVDTPATATTPAISRFYWRGYGVDASQQASSPVVKLYRSGRLEQTIPANIILPVATLNLLKAAGYTGMLATTPYEFNIELDPIWHNGDPSAITARLVINAPTGVRAISTTLNICGAPTYAWPWLQTSGGDVIASGQINGQITSLSNDFTPGARRDNAPDKEAEFLIISASILVGGGPFCSTYNYILTNITATTSCDNGAGYTLNNYQLNSGGKDVIVEGVEKAIREGVTNCDLSSTKTQIKTSLPAEVSGIITLPSCASGLIYDLTTATATTSSAISIPKGRVTIYVDGNLNIKNNIIYNAVGGITNIKDYPNLAIVVKGNVNIDPSVIGITALIYATGKIDTCATATGPSLTQNCSTRSLKVAGSLAAKNGIRFGRSFYNTAPLPTSNRPPAEWIELTPQTFVYPAPGIDLQFALSQQKGAYTLDPGEYNPRF